MQLETLITEKKTITSTIKEFVLHNINIGLQEEGITVITYTTIDNEGKKSQKKFFRTPTDEFIKVFIGSFQGVPTEGTNEQILSGLEQFIFNLIRK